MTAITSFNFDGLNPLTLAVPVLYLKYEMFCIENVDLTTYTSSFQTVYMSGRRCNLEHYVLNYEAMCVILFVLIAQSFGNFKTVTCFCASRRFSRWFSAGSII